MDTTRYKKILEDEKRLLESELAHVGVRNPSNAADWIPKADALDIQTADANELADRHESYVTNEGIETTLETRLASVAAALKRIEDGTYGTCDVCGEEIDSKRLEANPAATTCIAHTPNT